MKYHGIGGEYLRPRTINRYRIIKNKEQFFKRPSRTQGLLNGKKIIDKMETPSQSASSLHMF